MEIFFSHLAKQVDTPNKLTPLSMKLYGKKVIIYYEKYFILTAYFVVLENPVNASFQCKRKNAIRYSFYKGL